VNSNEKAKNQMKSAKKEGSDTLPAKKTAHKSELTEGVDE